MSYLLDYILKELKAQNESPIATHIDGDVTYDIYGAISVDNVTGYTILRTTAPSPEHTYYNYGFLLESDRVDGANGSSSDVNLKTDSADTILLLENPSITYE